MFKKLSTTYCFFSLFADASRYAILASKLSNQSTQPDAQQICAPAFLCFAGRSKKHCRTVKRTGKKTLPDGQKNAQNKKAEILRKTLTINEQLTVKKTLHGGQKSGQKRAISLNQTPKQVQYIYKDTPKQERRLRNAQSAFLPPFIMFSATKQKNNNALFRINLPLSIGFAQHRLTIKNMINP